MAARSFSSIWVAFSGKRKAGCYRGAATLDFHAGVHVEEMEIQHMTSCKHDKSSGSSAARSAAKCERRSERNESGSANVEIINCSTDPGIYLSHIFMALFHNFRLWYFFLAFVLHGCSSNNAKQSCQYKDVRFASSFCRSKLMIRHVLIPVWRHRLQTWTWLLIRSLFSLANF